MKLLPMRNLLLVGHRGSRRGIGMVRGRQIVKIVVVHHIMVSRVTKESFPRRIVKKSQRGGIGSYRGEPVVKDDVILWSDGSRGGIQR